MPHVTVLGDRVFKEVHACSVASVVSTLCDPMDCSPPGSSALEILQARILEWVATFFSRGSAWIGRQILYTEPPGKPLDSDPGSNLSYAGITVIHPPHTYKVR